MSTVAPPRTSRRGWVALLVLVVVAVVVLVVIGVGGSSGAQPLSTTGTGADGSQALARLLTARGTAVGETSSLDDARSGPADRTILVLDPTVYAAAQLQGLVRSTQGTVVLLAPTDDGLDAVGVPAALDRDSPSGVETVPAGCDLAAARSAGPVAFDTSLRYTAHEDSVAQCYEGRLLQAGNVVVLGDSSLLTNARLADDGAAALDLDLLGTTSSLVWLRPGADAAGPTGSVWDALPPHSGTAAVWLLVVGLLLVLWRGRRLGAPVAEPLPVVVRAAELVHGRARLYLRSGAVGPAAAALRGATVARLRSRLALPATTSPEGVEHAVAQRLARSGDRLEPGLLQGGTPADDDALTLLAAALGDLEQRVARAGRAGSGP